jgi:hypothetical protein
MRALLALWVTCAGEDQAKMGAAACRDLATGEASSQVRAAGRRSGRRQALGDTGDAADVFCPGNRT